MKVKATPAVEIAIAGEPPTELAKLREMIKAAVDAAANGVMEDIKALRAQLDDLESLVLQNAVRVTESLNNHVGICEAAQIEVSRLSGIVADMRKTQIDASEPLALAPQRTNGGSQREEVSHE